MNLIHLSPLVLLLAYCGTTYSYFISIDAHAEECFFDKVTSGTKMSLMFEVAEGGFLDIDIKVRCVKIVTLFIDSCCVSPLNATAKFHEA